MLISIFPLSLCHKNSFIVDDAKVCYYFYSIKICKGKNQKTLK